MQLFFPLAISHPFFYFRGIHRNPPVFPEPDAFNPDRYHAENRLPYPHRQGYSAFGFGRRVCAGQALAGQSNQSSKPFNKTGH
jgi:cytochrome P450